MLWPTLKITRARYSLLAEKPERFSQFPEACIRGAMGYYLNDLICSLNDSHYHSQKEQAIRLYELLIGPYGDKQDEPKKATPPRLSTIFIKRNNANKHLFELEFTTFGNNQDMLNLFYQILFDLGKEGVGKLGIHYEVDTKVSLKSGTLRDFACLKIIDDGDKDIVIDFYTPTTLRAYGGNFLTTWSADAFARNLSQRLNALCNALNEDLPEQWNISAFIDSFKTLNTVVNVQMKNRLRTSSRQHQQIDYSGFIGQVYLKKVPLEILCFLLAGEQIAVGKNTTFGSGRYRIDFIQHT